MLHLRALSEWVCVECFVALFDVSVNSVSVSVNSLQLKLPRQQWSLLNRFRTEQGHCGACRRKWQLTDTDLFVARPRRCLTLSNPVPWQNWMVAYLGYTLRMNTLFCGWPVMAHETHTRRRRMSPSFWPSTTHCRRRLHSSLLLSMKRCDSACHSNTIAYWIVSWIIMADTFNRRFTDCLYVYCKTTVVTDCVLKYFWSRRRVRLSMQIRPISNFYDYHHVSDVLIDLAPSIVFCFH